MEQHLDEEKPEGAENEAIEQVAHTAHMHACMHVTIPSDQLPSHPSPQTSRHSHLRSADSLHSLRVTRITTYLLIYIPTHLLTYASTYLLIYLPTHYQSTYLLTCLPTYLPTYLLTPTGGLCRPAAVEQGRPTYYLPTYLPTYLTTYLLPQVAFADRLLLNKVDLVSAEDLARIEGARRIHAYMHTCTLSLLTTWRISRAWGTARSLARLSRARSLKPYTLPTAYLLPPTAYLLPPTAYLPPPTSHFPPTASYRLPPTSYGRILVPAGRL